MARAVDRYTYRVTWSEEDNEYVGLCAKFPSLSWLEVTPEAALSGIRSLVRKSVDDLKRNKEAVPEPISESGVSLNRLISSKLA
jgi:predicted RNase H-like HicB family nuclease